MQSKIMWGLVILSIGVIVFCATVMMERYETEIWTTPSPEVRENPFVAAQRFLENRGVTVEKTTNTLDFKTIETDQTVILTLVDSMLVSQSKIDDAIDWVERGGYLIVGVGAEVEGHSSILKRFEIEPRRIEVEVDDVLLGDDREDMTTSEQLRKLNQEIEERKKKKAQTASDNDGAQDGEQSDDSESDSAPEQSLFGMLNSDFQNEFFKLQVDAEDDLYIAVLDDIVLDHKLLYDHENYDSKQHNGYTLNSWSSDENGVRLLQLYYGDGSLVALSSSNLWKNKNIGVGDHAYFLSYLVPDDSTLQLFYNIEAPSLFSLIHRYFYELVWSAIALLAFWLWYRGIRIQRVRSKHEVGRRNFAEHLRSSAEFLTRTEQYITLLTPLKEDIEQQLKSEHPNFSHLNSTAQVAILAGKTQLPDTQLENWLKFCKQIDSREQLFSALKLGNAIRKQL